MSNWQPPNPDNNYGYPVPSFPPPAEPVPPKKNRVPLIIVGVVAVVLVGVAATVAITSDGPGSAAVAEATETTTSAAPTMSATERDAAFYQFVQRHPYSEDGNTREDWIDLAGSMCGAFDRGATYNDVATILVQEMSDMDLTEAKEFVRQAVTIYCPEHTGAVN